MSRLWSKSIMNQKIFTDGGEDLARLLRALGRITLSRLWLKRGASTRPGRAVSNQGSKHGVAQQRRVVAASCRRRSRELSVAMIHRNTRAAERDKRCVQRRPRGPDCPGLHGEEAWPGHDVDGAALEVGQLQATFANQASDSRPLPATASPWPLEVPSPAALLRQLNASLCASNHSDGFSSTIGQP